MRPKNNSSDQSRTFIEAARRAQIISCAVDAIAELGYAQASFAQIAKRAGISKGVISYHFANKEELMSEVVHTGLTAFAQFVGERLAVETTASETLRLFIEANLAFIGEQRQLMLAVMEILANAKLDQSRSLVAEANSDTDIENLSQLLREGQEKGEFRSFDTRTMAVAIMSIRNGVLNQISQNPGLDLAAYSREIVTLVDLATRKGE